MAATRMHGDVLVLGHALEAAITATLLTRRGWKVIWVGTPPPATTTLDGTRITTAPGLVPSLQNAPGLARALEETGLTADVQKLLRPVPLQFLDERRRLSLPRDAPESAWSPVRVAAEDLRALADVPWDLGFFGRRRLAKRRLAIESPLSRPEALAGEAAEALGPLVSSGPDSLPSALRLLADPHDLPGGRVTLVALLYKRFIELGGSPVALPGTKAAESIQLGWSGVRVVLDSGDELSARLLVLGLDDAEREHLLPAADLRPMQKLEPKLAAAEAHPLHRMTWIVHPRGLPVPLGPAAILQCDGKPALVERRAIDAAREEISVSWRSDPTPLPQQEVRVVTALRGALPFFERHVITRLGPAPVPHHQQQAQDRDFRPARRLLHARSPILGLGGLEGGALLGAALAARSQQLAPRKDLLK